MKMSKLAALAGVAIMAVASAQANTVTWGFQWAYSLDPTGTAPNTFAGVFSQDRFDNGIQNGSAWLVVLSVDDTDGISVNQSSGALIESANVLKSFASSGGVSGGKATDDAITSTRWYAVVIYDSDTHLFGISDTVLGSAMGMQEIPAPGFPGANDNFKNINTQGWDAIVANQPIPEPTTLALLALGVAAVGLRRRFLKK